MTNYPAAPQPGDFGDGGDAHRGEPNHGSSPPVCPRHPGRVSFVRCQRCNRPACPECQHTAAVGVQCVDCVRQCAQQQRSRRTVFGGRAVGRPPYATLCLIGTTVAIFRIGMVTPALYNAFIFWPAVGLFEPHRAITSGFLHGGLMHLLFNMYALWLIGPQLEHMFGRLRFLGLYFLSLFGGTVAVVLFASPGSMSWRIGVVGASGAVFGLFGAIALVFRRMGRNAQPIIVIIAINVVFSFVVRGISWQGHLGGLVTGLIVATVLTKLPSRLQRFGGPLALIAIAVMLVGAYYGLYITK